MLTFVIELKYKHTKVLTCSRGLLNVVDDLVLVNKNNFKTDNKHPWSIVIKIKRINVQGPVVQTPINVNPRLVLILD